MSTADNLIITRENRPHCHIIRMAGALSSKNLLDIRAVFDDTLKTPGIRIALDLSSIEFLDSMGIGILINFNKRLIKNTSQLVVINPSEVVREIFDVADTGKFIRVRDVTAADLASVFD